MRRPPSSTTRAKTKKSRRAVPTSRISRAREWAHHRADDDRRGDDRAHREQAGVADRHASGLAEREVEEEAEAAERGDAERGVERDQQHALRLAAEQHHR